MNSDDAIDAQIREAIEREEQEAIWIQEYYGCKKRENSNMEQRTAEVEGSI